MVDDTYTIPANFTDAGKLFGAFEIRNAVEAVILGVPILFFCAWFLPFGLTAKMVVTMIFFVPATGFALIGISDDSLSRHLICWRRYRRRRAVLTYRGEVK